MAKSIRIPLAGIALSLVALAAAAQSSNAQAAPTRDYHIESQPLPAAVNDWADQAGMQVMWSAKMPGAQREAPEVAGRFSAPMALERVLQGSGLTFAFLDEQTVAIRLASAAGQSSSSAGAVGSEVRSPSPSEGEGTREDPKGGEGRGEDSKQSVRGPDSAAASKAETISEVIVTGTHIRAVSMSSPVLIIDRDAIDRSGYSTTHQLLQNLPQNVNDISDTTFGSINGGGDGAVGDATAINLRGLGGDSTLVLLNGRRIASAADGSFVDVSLIPLSAVERIDVLTDGASAIYGSDAIAGVVNIVLREKFDGAETSLRYGTVTQGASDEVQVAQTFGHSWNTGNALISYEYYRRTALESESRDFIDNTDLTLDLAPKQERHNFLVTGTQALSEEIKLSGDFFYGNRKSASDYVIFGIPVAGQSDFTQYSASVGSTVRIGSEWQANLSTLYGRNTSRGATGCCGLGLSPSMDYKTTVWSADAGAEGPVWSFSAGDSRLAFGAHYRNEALNPLLFAGISGSPKLSRNVAAAYAELLVPIVSAANRRRGIERLEFTAAGRYEHYSDFGSTTNPKFGISWAPVPSLNLRSTYGTSFKAPRLSQLNPVDTFAAAYDLPDPSAPLGFIPTIVVTGSASNLDPEEATTWSVGFDFTPLIAEGLALRATYFNISFDGRIASPIPDDARLFDALTDPTYSQFINRDPDLGIIEGLFASPGFFNISSAATPGEIGVLANSRLTNIASSELSGIDLTLDMAWALGTGHLSIQLSGDYLLNGSRRVLPGTPETDTLNSVFNQVDFRMRDSVSWSQGGLVLTGFLNYTDGYRDDRPALQAGPDQRSNVASWTTFDFTAGYEFVADGSSEWLSGTEFSFTLLNAFDRDPPWIASTLGLHFDGVNATPMGRSVAFQVRKAW